MRANRPSAQKGVALAVALILLTMLTLISLFAASTGSVELKMTQSMQTSLDSFHSAEAGIDALMALVGTSSDPFNGEDNETPFKDLKAKPLDALNDGADSMTVRSVLVLSDAPCPRSNFGYSVDLVVCDHYRAESTHETEEARSQVTEGVAKPLIGGASL